MDSNNSSSSNNNNSGGRGRGRGRGGRGRGRGRSGGGRGGRGRGRGRSQGGGGGGGRSDRGRDAATAPSQASTAADTTLINKRDQKSRPSKQQNVENKKVNGEKGAEAHTVSEEFRIKFTEMLLDFREQAPDTEESLGGPARLEFDSSLTNTERKYIHEIAAQLGLASKSTGKGENRRITVSLKKERKKAMKLGGSGEGNNDGESSLAVYEKEVAYMDSLPKLHLPSKGLAALQRHLQKYPPSLDDDDGAINLNRKIPPAARTKKGQGLSQSLPTLSSRQKQIMIEQQQRRKQRHEFYQTKKLQTKNKQRYDEAIEDRSKLPAFAKQDEIVAMVANNPVTIIKGETGCGKSTQVPQFLLDANPSCNIAVTQPRRISAVSIAERVAQEQCIGEGGKTGVGSLVGYQVRLQAATSSDTQLVFLTPGILLRKLQSSPMLLEYSHIIIDEVHEMERNTEFLLITLRDLLPKRPDLRLILMSATLRTDVLLNYFSTIPTNSDDVTVSSYYKQFPPAMIEIEGRTYPVQEFFLEHVLQLTKFIDVDELNAIEDEEKDGANNVMSMDDLDAELENFLSGGGKSRRAIKNQQADVAETLIKCAFCGQLFKSASDLGVHVISCPGEVDNVESPENSLPTPATMLHEFEEYDDDAVPDALNYQFLGAADHTSSGGAEDSTAKWDGKGEFEVDTEFVIDERADRMLSKYQTMHDDEDVDTDLLVEVLHYINETSHGKGAILVFLPGWQEISEVSMLLENTVPFNNRSKFLVLPLHSGIPSGDQRKVLRRPPPGIRKIVLSTNIAETSLTIEDVAFVVDSGRAKEKTYDPHLKTSTLTPTWVSRSSARQRKGRAGRTKRGVCFHLFSSRRFANMRPFVESELLRTPLEEMCLMAKKLGLAPGGQDDNDGVKAFLSKAMTPPHEKSIENALSLLVDIGAMVPETSDLTTLGECLAVLSLEPRVGKMVVMSYLLGCAMPMEIMAIAMSYRNPFILPPQKQRREAEQAQLKLSDGMESDQLLYHNVIVQAANLKKQGDSAYFKWTRRNYLSPSTLNMCSDLRRNLSRELTSLGFPDPTQSGYHNRHSYDQALWLSTIAAGLYPNCASRKRGEVNFSTMANRKAKIHVSSVNSLPGQPFNSKCRRDEELVVYGEMVRGTHFFTLQNTTHIPSPLPLLLLCGTKLSVHTPKLNGHDGGNDKSVLSLDDWLVFSVNTDFASSLVILRNRLEGSFWNLLSKRNVSDGKRSKGIDIQSVLTEKEQDALETLDLVLDESIARK